MKSTKPIFLFPRKKNAVKTKYILTQYQYNTDKVNSQLKNTTKKRSLNEIITEDTNNKQNKIYFIIMMRMWLADKKP